MPRPPTIGEFKRRSARRLRQNATDAELRLWRHLKRLETRGTHFRRQMPIGDFVADFSCPAARLIVEVDGSQHGEVENAVSDRRRTEWLNSQGYRVLRFWNNDVTQNISGVMEAIYSALYGSTESEPRNLKHKRHRRAVP
jgi:very-short-patch-repair endonuclease